MDKPEDTPTQPYLRGEVPEIELRRGMITSFSGEYRFLSNFWLCLVQYQGTPWPSTEHAFQAAKSPTWSQLFQKCATPGDAKRLGRRCPLREDWEEVRLQVMLDITRIKYINHPTLGRRLLDTGNAQLVEGNTWGDTFWGCVNEGGVWRGENNLGKILMQVRTEIE